MVERLVSMPSTEVSSPLGFQHRAHERVKTACFQAESLAPTAYDICWWRPHGFSRNEMMPICNNYDYIKSKNWYRNMKYMSALYETHRTFWRQAFIS